MEDANEMLAQQQQELERIRNKRVRHTNTEGIRKILNVAFLAIALTGVVLYFMYPDKHLLGMIVIGIGMVVKIVEFFIRIML